MEYGRSRVVVDPFGQMLAGYRSAQKDYFDAALKRAQMANFAARTRSTLDANSRANSMHAYQAQIAQINAAYAKPLMDQRLAHGGLSLDQQRQALARGNLSMDQQRLNIAQSGLSLERGRWQFGQDKTAAEGAPGSGSSRLNLSGEGGPAVATPASTPPGVVSPFSIFTTPGDVLAGQDRAKAASDAKRAASTKGAFEDAIGAGAEEDAGLPPLHEMLSEGFNF